jgi:hypothetical protein
MMRILCSLISQALTTRAGGVPALIAWLRMQVYVVLRGTTAMAVAGTIVPEPEKVQP